MNHSGDNIIFQINITDSAATIVIGSENHFWNRIAEKAVKLRPDVQLVTYVYSYYRYPPRREKVEYPDNLLFGMVPQMFEDNRKMFEAWWKAGARQVFLRPNDLCAGMPFTRGLERLIYDKFQASRKSLLLSLHDESENRC